MKEKAEKTAEWAGHYALPLFTVCTAVYITDNCLGNPQSGWMARLDTAAGLLSLSVMFALFRYHSLCLRCAAKTPLNPERSVKRARTALRLCHWRYLFRFVIGGMLLTIIGSLIEPGKRPVWANAADSAFDIAVLLVFAAVTVHERLRPWCPWCKWRDDGDEEISPEVPDPSVSK